MFNKIFLFKILKNNQLDFRNIVKKMNIPIRQNKDFSSFLFKLIKNGELFQTNDRKYFLPNFIGSVSGMIKLNPKGFGFVDLEENKSIFILGSNSKTALNGDEVLVKYFKDPFKKDSYQGVVKKIIKRNKLSFVGRVKKFYNNWGIIPFDKKINGKFRFVDTTNLMENMEVKVEIIEFEADIKKIKIIKKLGMSNDDSIDIIIAIEDANVLTEFSNSTLQEALSIPSTTKNEDIGKRIDLRNELIYTIDGDDTKDFDDAIQVKKLSNENYKLGVHIADVTHYVKENKPIDEEAKERGTSVYLVDRVIPMLPEKLSNGICSLNPNVDRFVLSCEMEINKNGETVSYKVFPAIINSKYRLTYKEVNNFQKGIDKWDNPLLSESLKNALNLSKIIRKNKNKEGYIDFEIEESKIIVDEHGKTKDIVAKERLYSEILIEDFMVRANETVAKFIADKNLSFIYRIHDKPSYEKIEALQNILKILKIDIKVKNDPTPLEFANSVREIKKSHFYDFMKIIMLRTMSKAEYSKSNIGHFGLASKFYTHFTSPIRRYPDLMVHRMIREYIFNKKPELSNHFGKILIEIAAHSSLKEQKSVELERKVADIKKAEFYEQFIGQKIEGIIVSVLKFGLFIEFPNKVNGLLHVSTLIDGVYSLDETGFILSNGKRTFTIGDKISTYIDSVNKQESKIELVYSDLYEEFKKNKNNEKKHY